MRKWLETVNCQVTIAFREENLADANRMAAELRGYLLDLVDDLQVETGSAAGDHQDFGSVLVLLLGSSAVTV